MAGTALGAGATGTQTWLVPLLPPTIAGSAVGNLNDTILKPNVNYSVTAEVTARCVTPSVDLN